MARSREAGAPGPSHDVLALTKGLKSVTDRRDDGGRRVGSAKCGVYAFYDYDGEPIYVGQTYEKLGGRISRHLTNQRTDAVAMSVLDPFEVAEIELWPFWDLQDEPTAVVKETLRSAEHTVYQQLIRQSRFGAVLNEAAVASAAVIELPESFRGRIVPDELYGLRKHPDVRIARRAGVIARLAQVISERHVKKIGLRRTLLTQARRLEDLSRRRVDELTGALPEGAEGHGES